ncbi:hypothetical protein [Oleidesulfovibrio alaskensis]|jgi:hypothetical protein|uniref:hypothetical protein n=1 Tax=Oleidesulfovibrio alaskensis TaxID=58180 RepID=UPI000420F1E5|nr:hypothetical protein [Oleidesulfovibrio alaskensis]
MRTVIFSCSALTIACAAISLYVTIAAGSHCYAAFTGRQAENSTTMGTSVNATQIRRNDQGDLIIKTTPRPARPAANSTVPVLIITPEITLPVNKP